MQNENELKVFNDAIANKKLTWWEIHNSQPGHDRDELYLQFEDGSVVSITAERREVGCALTVKLSELPQKPVINLTA